MKYSGIGGQAVIEGIMMKNKDEYATAVRTPSGKIEVKKEIYISIVQKYPILKLPFVRGIFAFSDSMILGMRSLKFSASFFEDDEGEPSKFEKFLDKVFGEKLEKVIMTLSIIFSFFVAIGIFILLPLFLSSLIKRVVDNHFIISLVEGIIRISIFVIYIKLISNMKDIGRTFMYHGAEHKCINCIETGNPLTVENVMKSSRLHKRCGTSFIIIVMIISILFFMLIRVDNVWLRFVIRILLIPVIAGVSFEFLNLAGRSDSKIVDFFSKPGFWMQGLTTAEPTEDMVEVAIVAVEEVFDWKKCLDENF